MYQETLVDRQITDGERYVAALRADNFDVSAACWARTSEEGHWYFYIASQDVDRLGIHEAYKRVLAVRRRMVPPCAVQGTRVKLVPASNPITADLLRIQQNFQVPLPYRGTHIGNVPIEEAYVYATAPS